MKIPHRELRPEQLHEVITDYIRQVRAIKINMNKPMSEKIGRVKQLLETGEVAIVFEKEGGVCNIKSHQEMRNDDPRFKISKN